MRGLPSSGKTYTAKRIASQGGGRVFETDSFFMSQVGSASNSYDFKPELVPKAQAWNFERYKAAIKHGVSPIVVDRGNSLALDSKVYAVYAKHFDYTVRLSEPKSPWWQEIRVLLKYKQENRSALQLWAKKLARMNAKTHKVPVEVILHWMEYWKHDLTVDDIIRYRPEKIPSPMMNKMTLENSHLFGKRAPNSRNADNNNSNNNKVQSSVSRLFDGKSVAATAVLPVESDGAPLIYDDSTGRYRFFSDAEGNKSPADRKPTILWEKTDELLDFIS